MHSESIDFSRSQNCIGSNIIFKIVLVLFGWQQLYFTIQYFKDYSDKKNIELNLEGILRLAVTISLVYFFHINHISRILFTFDANEFLKELYTALKYVSSQTSFCYANMILLILQKNILLIYWSYQTNSKCGVSYLDTFIILWEGEGRLGPGLRQFLHLSCPSGRLFEIINETNVNEVRV